MPADSGASYKNVYVLKFECVDGKSRFVLTSAARTDLGYRPRISFEAGLREMVATAGRPWSLA